MLMLLFIGVMNGSIEKIAQHTYNTRDLIIHDYITTINYSYVRCYQMVKKK